VYLQKLGGKVIVNDCCELVVISAKKSDKYLENI